MGVDERGELTCCMSRGVPPKSFSSFGYDGAAGADQREHLARFQQFSAKLPPDRDFDFSVPAVLP